MRKKLFIFTILLILLIILFLIIREFKINNDNIYTYNTLSRNSVIELLDKGANYNNYYRSVYTDNGHEEFYFKDNKLAHYTNSTLDYWMNLSENEKEMIQIEDKETKVANNIEDFNSIIFPMEYTQLGFYCSIYDEQNWNFKYIGLTKLNERDTIIASSISKNDLFKKFEIKYYIDKETGVIVKTKQIKKIFMLSTDILNLDRGVQFDIVTDKIVEKPDLTGYEIHSEHIPALTIW